MIKKYWPVVIIFFLVASLFIANYQPGTWLSGWDNLHPEFDFKTNIVDRSIFGVWQQYQGLGILSGNAHSADLPRQIGLFILSLFLPSNLLRYVYHFFALFVGGSGAYFLIFKLLNRQKNDSRTLRMISLSGSVFYLLNLGTMQNFYVPYESFSHFFASLPWALYSLFNLFDRFDKRNLLFFCLVSFLAIPMFYIPTIFIVFMLIVGLVCLDQLVRDNKIISLKKILIILILIFSINSYWLMPFGYFIKNGISFVKDAKINRMFSQEAFLRNQMFGNIGSVSVLKGFLFNTTDLVNNAGEHDFMMQPWIKHLGKFPINIILYIYPLLIVIGIVHSFSIKNNYSRYIFYIFILSIFALINDNFPTGFLFQFIQNMFPVLKQVFRFPYTKFVVPASLAYSVYFSFFLLFLSSGVKRLPGKSQLASFILIITIFSGGLIWIAFPSFQGNFIYPKVKVAIPEEYFALFSYFRNQKQDGRIANFPQPTYWGWINYDWGYRGSGFPWYGIKQPMLDRAFDVWNPKNEDYFREVSYALYSNNLNLLEKVLQKYNVSFIWIDERVIVPHNVNILYADELKQMLGESDDYKLEFNTGKQSVYKYNKDPNLTSIIKDATALNNNTKYISYDPVFDNLGNYYNSIGQNGINYLYADIDGFDQNSFITRDKDETVLKTKIPYDGVLSVPPISESESDLLVNYQMGEDRITFNTVNPKIKLNNEVLDIPSIYYQESFNKIILSNDILQLNNQIITDSRGQIRIKDNNFFAIYKQEAENGKDVSKKLFDKTKDNCQKEKSSNTLVAFGNDLGQDSLTLLGFDSKPCVYGKLEELLDNNGYVSDQPTQVIEINFDFISKNKEKPQLCLTKDDDDQCFFQAGGEVLPIENVWTTVKYTVAVSDIPLSKIWMKLELNASKQFISQEITYKNIFVQVYQKPSLSRNFSIKDSGKVYKIQVRKNDNISISGFVTAQKIKPWEYPQEKKNCYAFGVGPYDRRISSDTVIGSFVEYSAKDSSSCEYFSLNKIQNNSGLIARLQTKNIKGRPIKISLKVDPAGHYLFEDILLNAEKTWSDIYFITPLLQDTLLNNYFLEIDNYAVGTEERVNQLGEIDIIYFPYNWVKSLYLDNGNQKLNENNDKEIIDYEKLNTVFYYVNFGNNLLGVNNDNNQMLVFNQSFQKGWHAYQITNDWLMDSWYMRLLIPFFGQELEDHVLVNNWANGWRIGDQNSDFGIQNTGKNSQIAGSRLLTTIVIIYLPQYLEYLGFGLLFFIPLFIFFSKKIPSSIHSN